MNRGFGCTGKGLDVFGRMIFGLAIAGVLAFAVSAEAGVLGSGTGTTYNNTFGTLAYSLTGPGGALTGTVEYAVYESADVPAAFTGVTPAAGKAVYIYQVFNTGSTTANGYQVFTSEYNTVAVDPSQGGESSAVGTLEPTSLTWIFNHLAFDGLQAGENSQLLWFESDKEPSMTGGFSLVHNGGSSALVSGIAVPGTNDIPEPASLALIGLGALVLIRRRG